MQTRFDAFKTFGAVAGTLVSALFLFAIAFANVLVLISIYRTFQKVKAGGRFVEEDLDMALANRGLLGRLFRRFFRLVEKSWHMYPLGLLFGLGFDTATEVGLLGISATQAAQGLPIWSILVFPALFTAGMTLLDTTDSILMLGAYGWAFIKPVRKLYYNLTITAASVIVAVVVGGLETLNLIGDQLGLTDGGGFWGAIGDLNDNFGTLGYIIVGVFALAWVGLLRRLPRQRLRRDRSFGLVSAKSRGPIRSFRSAMCIGLPMRVVEGDELVALCERRGLGDAGFDDAGRRAGAGKPCARPSGLGDPRARRRRGAPDRRRAAGALRRGRGRRCRRPVRRSRRPRARIAAAFALSGKWKSFFHIGE